MHGSSLARNQTSPRQGPKRRQGCKAESSRGALLEALAKHARGDLHGPKTSAGDDRQRPSPGTEAGEQGPGPGAPLPATSGLAREAKKHLERSRAALIGFVNKNYFGTAAAAV